MTLQVIFSIQKKLSIFIYLWRDSENREYSSMITCKFLHDYIFLVALIGIDGGNTTKMSRFANYLRNLLPSNDQVVMQMASKAMGRLALTGGTFTADYVEFEVKRALEWLGGDRNEGRRHAAVSTYLGSVVRKTG